jgi:hypothetical protein
MTQNGKQLATVWFAWSPVKLKILSFIKFVVPFWFFSRIRILAMGYKRVECVMRYE